MKKMKNLKNNALKSLLIVALFCSVAFAEGDMGGGGFTDCENPTDVPPVVKCEEGDMGGGGRMANTDTTLDTFYLFLEAAIREIF
jgi:hypothetical protein